MSVQYNKETFRKIIEESKALNRLGQVIKDRTLPSVVKNLGFVSPGNRKAKEVRNNGEKVLQALKIADETFRTLPSLRHSSYKNYRNSPHPRENSINIEPVKMKMMWSPETVIASSVPIKVDKFKRTQILKAEKIYGTERYRKRSDAKENDNKEKEERMEEFEKIFERIKKRSEKRASDTMRFSLEY